MFGDYVIGKLYNRKIDIHDRFGGSRQSGISPSADYPVVFIFTGASGARHGYDDNWDDIGNLRYFGQGQVGDMEFIRGNSAIRRKDNTPYLEPHHIRRVGDGGPDHPRYVIALCPNCHREAHFGSRIKELQSHHLKIVDKAEGADLEMPSDQP